MITGLPGTDALGGREANPPRPPSAGVPETGIAAGGGAGALAGGASAIALYAVVGLLGAPISAPTATGGHLTGMAWLTAPSFGYVIGNWYAIMSRTKRLTAFTASYGQAATIFPYVVVAPAYFAKSIQLGDMMQTGSAFGQVQDALSFFVTAYRTIAEWRAIVARLDGFEMSVETAANLPAHEATIELKVAGGSRNIGLDKLCVYLPNGTPLVAADGFAIQAPERVLVTGPSGAVGAPATTGPAP